MTYIYVVRRLRVKFTYKGGVAAGGVLLSLLTSTGSNGTASMNGTEKGLLMKII